MHFCIKLLCAKWKKRQWHRTWKFYKDYRASYFEIKQYVTCKFNFISWLISKLKNKYHLARVRIRITYRRFQSAHKTFLQAALIIKLRINWCLETLSKRNIISMLLIKMKMQSNAEKSASCTNFNAGFQRKNA